MKNIYILGSLNTDLVIKSPYMPISGETITGSDFMTNYGGKGANQAVACGKLGGNVYMAGAVGDDVFGKAMLKNLKKYKVNSENIRICKGTPSGTAVIIIVDGDNRIILDKGANGEVTFDDVDKLLENAKEGDIFLTQLENPIDIIGYGLKQAKKKGLFTILNPAPYNKACEEYFPFVDMITPNRSELKLFSGSDDLDESCEMMMKKGICEVVVTLGSRGYCYFSHGISSYGECIKVKVVDTTAAGDTFCGALAVELSRGEKIEKALRFASVAASLAVTKRGAQISIPKREAVERRTKMK